MTTFQISAIVVVAILVLTNFIDFKGLFSKLTTKKYAAPVTPVLSNDVPTISQIVEQWDKLKNMCISAGSKHSSKELDNVFLALLDKEEVKSEKS